MFSLLFLNLFFFVFSQVYTLQNQVANLTKYQVDIFLLGSYFSILSSQYTNGILNLSYIHL